MIDSTATQASAGTPNQTAAQKASDKLDEQYQQFLTLLTAQISNQDPLKPMDSTQFVSQLAQLSQVEQGVATNRNLEAVLEQLQGATARSDLDLMGRDVLVASDTVTLGDTGFGAAFELGADADKVTARILAEDGTLVRELDLGAASAGEIHDLAWNGRDAQGLPVPPGTLRVEISAVDSEGAQVASETLARTRVEGVSFAQTGAALHLATGAQVNSLAVRSVR